ncbi:MAG: hypothetical protein ACRENP_08165 [Longimicrobiales bacterium]
MRAHGEPLTVPPYADDGGEEPEIAGVYLIDPAGTPRRIGMTMGNEFSDHVLERRNYLYLAHSKLRNCAVGPELVVDPDFNDHHFKYAAHRRPGDLHVHFFGADAFSFGAGIALEPGDVMRVHFEGFGRPLCNPIELQRGPRLVTVQPV